jgi:hypothetical protein
MLMLQIKQSDGWHTLNRRDITAEGVLDELQEYMHHWRTIMPMGTFRIFYDGTRGRQ